MARWTAQVKQAEERAAEAERARNAAEILAGRQKGLASQMQAVAHQAIELARLLVNISPIRPSPGVYFLMKRGAVVYVGQSENVLTRMGGHVLKDFDDVRMLPVPAAAERDRLEQAFIHLLVPPLNVARQQFNAVQPLLAHPEIERSGVSAKTPAQRGVAAGN